MMRSSLPGFAAFAILAALQGEAHAQPAPDVPVKLEWIAPSECPSRDSVLARVGAFLRGSSAPPAGVVARAAVSQQASRWHIEMAIRTPDGAGARAFDSESCESLANTAAFILALAVDPTHPPSVADLPPTPAGPGTPGVSSDRPTPQGSPSALPAPPSPPPAEAPETRPSPALPPTSEPAGSAAATEDAIARRSQRRRRFPPLAVGASAIVDDGSLPSLAYGGELALAWRPAPWRLELEGSLVSPQNLALASLPGASADFSLLAIGGRGCLARSVWRLELAPCIGGEVDHVNATGHGLATTLHGSATAFDATALGLATLVLPPFAIRVGAEALLPSVRPEFVVIQPSNAPALFVHRAAAVEGRWMLGLEVRFP